MTHLANFSGQEVVKILQKHFGFFFVSQKGSHIKLRRRLEGAVITTIVPDHHELVPGTLRGVLNQAQVTMANFIKLAGD